MVFFVLSVQFGAQQKAKSFWLREPDLNRFAKTLSHKRFAFACPPCGTRNFLRLGAPKSFDHYGICRTSASPTGSEVWQIPTSHARRSHNPKNIMLNPNLKTRKNSAHHRVFRVFLYNENHTLSVWFQRGFCR